jgi:hypothetical protein
LQTLRELQWDQKVGEWGFRVSFWVQLIWSLPLLVFMTFKVSGVLMSGLFRESWLVCSFVRFVVCLLRFVVVCL